jgi:hypothetical protein
MKNFILIFAALFICAGSFAQTQWTNVSYADDDLEGHKLDIVLPTPTSLLTKRWC